MTATLFAGGRIHVRAGVSAEALFQRDGRVVAVGRAADITKQAAGAERVDLAGGLMTPGWFDAHVHFMWWGFQMAEVDLRGCATLDAALRPAYLAAGSDGARWRVVVDQIASLTDTSAIAWHDRLCRRPAPRVPGCL